MDPLTHTLLGAAIARTSLGRTARYASVTLIVGANLPDVDVLSLLVGSDASMGFRRGWTHGPVAIATLPLVLAASVVGWDRWIRRGAAGPPAMRPWVLVGLAYLAALTHPLLDWLNTYGIRLLMPFRDSWYYGDAVFIVDPWLWLILGGTVFLSARHRRVRGWVGLAVAASLMLLLARDRLPAAAPYVWLAGLAGIALAYRSLASRSWRTPVAATGLVLASSYIVTMVACSAVLHRQVARELAEREVGAVERLMISPMPANPLRWGFVAQTADHYRFGSISVLPGSVLALDAASIARPQPSPVVDAALSAPAIQGTLGWMRFPFVEVDSSPDGHTVFVLDARYVKSRTRGFGGVVVELGPDLEPRRAR